MSSQVVSFVYGARSASPTGDLGQFTPLRTDLNGNLYVTLTSGSVIFSSIDPQADDQAPAEGLSTGALNYALDGTNWDRVRGATVFRSAVATAAGNTAVWTPTAGTRFRLMAWRLSVAGTLAAAGTQVLQLRDGATTVIARAGANVAQTLPSGDTQIGEDYGAFGQLSSTIDNVLNLNLGTAMATGAVYIDVWGTEE